jgi:HNH endonuclease
MEPLYHKTKKCSICHKEKLLTSFHKKKASSDGLSPDCKDCHCARKRKGPDRPIVQLSLFFRTCKDCHEEKSIEEFRPTKNGYRTICKDCDRQKALDYYYAHRSEEELQQKREYYATHREKRQQYYETYRASHRDERNQKSRDYRMANYEKEIERKRQYHATHREQEREYDRMHREAHPERIREQQQRYLEAHREQKREYTKNWRQTNPLKAREQWRRRSIRKQDASIEKVSYQAILERDGMHCYICNQPILPEHSLHFDHIIPLSRGGVHSMDNIAPTHAQCNLRKNNKLLSELDDHDRRGV